jgi:transcriptional regulator with XRE-family HTH domain
MTATVKDLLELAKQCISRGEISMREAAEHIDEAMRLDKGLTQRAVAERIGMSAAWVNRLLTWKSRGYKSETPFGPQSQASRKKAAAVQATKQPPEKVTPERLLRDKARAERDTANASAAEARAKAAEARHKAEQAKQEAEAERLRASRLRAKGAADISYEQRARLVKLLGMLGSESEGERATAAKKADDFRESLGLTWSNLIVPSRVHNVEDRMDPA